MAGEKTGNSGALGMSQKNKGPKGRASGGRGEPPKEEDKSRFTQAHEGQLNAAIGKKNTRKAVEPIVYKKAQVNLDRIKDTYRGFKVPELKDEDIVTAVDEAGRELPKELRKEYYDIVILYSGYDKEAVVALYQDLMEHIDLKAEHADDPQPHIALVDKAMDTGAIPALKQVEEALERTTYLFIYMTNNLCDDAWAELATHECLMEALNNKEAMWTIVPIHTSERRTKPYKVPFGLRSLKGIERSDSDPFFYENVKLLVDSSRYRFYRKHREQRDKAEDWIFEKVGSILKDRKKRINVIPEQLNGAQEEVSDDDRRRILLAELERLGGVPPNVAGLTTAGSPHYQPQPPGAYGGHPGSPPLGHPQFRGPPQGHYAQGQYPPGHYQQGHYHPGAYQQGHPLPEGAAYYPAHPVQGRHMQPPVRPSPEQAQPHIVMGEIVHQEAAGPGAVYHIHAQHVNIGDNANINVNPDGSKKDDDDAPPRFRLGDPAPPGEDPPGPPPGRLIHKEMPSVDNSKKKMGDAEVPLPTQIPPAQPNLLGRRSGAGPEIDHHHETLVGTDDPITRQGHSATQQSRISVQRSYSPSSSDGRGAGSNATPTMGSQQSNATISVTGSSSSGSSSGGADFQKKVAERQESALSTTGRTDATMQPLSVKNAGFQSGRISGSLSGVQPQRDVTRFDDDYPSLPSLCDNEGPWPSYNPDSLTDPPTSAPAPRWTGAASVPLHSGEVRTMDSSEVPIHLKDIHLKDTVDHSPEEQEAIRRKLQEVTLAEMTQESSRDSICLGGNQLPGTVAQQPSSSGKAPASAGSTPGKVNMSPTGVSYNKQGSGAPPPVLKSGGQSVPTQGYVARPPPTHSSVNVSASSVDVHPSSGSSEHRFPRTLDSVPLSSSSSTGARPPPNANSSDIPTVLDDPSYPSGTTEPDPNGTTDLDHNVVPDSSKSTVKKKETFFHKLFRR